METKLKFNRPRNAQALKEGEMKNHFDEKSRFDEMARICDFISLCHREISRHPAKELLDALMRGERLRRELESGACRASTPEEQAQAERFLSTERRFKRDLESVLDEGLEQQIIFC